MREITAHHDGHGLNESIIIEADESGPGGASHQYSAQIDTGGGYMRSLAHIQFQKGPRGESGSTPGMTDIALLAIVLDRLQAFNDGEFRCRENAIAITKIEEAMLWMKKRADERAKRGVLGTYNK